MEMDNDMEGFEPTKPPLIKVKCKYCGRYFEVAKEVQLNPETGEYEYTCPHCSRKFSSGEI